MFYIFLNKKFFCGNPPSKWAELGPSPDSLLKKEQDYFAEIKLLKEQIACLTGRLFNRKTEKLIDDPQLSLFDLPEEQFPIAEASQEEEESILGFSENISFLISAT